MASIKELLKTNYYNIIYGNKFKKFNIDKDVSEILILENNESYSKDILDIIKKSKNNAEFSKNIRSYLKNNDNILIPTLLIGNITGKYVFFNKNYYMRNLNIDAFSKDNMELLKILKDHFYEYIMSKNEFKNKFAKKFKHEKVSIRDLSQDITEEEIVKEFEIILNGKEKFDAFKTKIVADYILNIIGTYTKDDIKNNFDFILYDMNRNDKSSLDDRRKKYMLHNNLSINQLRKIDDVDILRKRLKGIGSVDANNLLSRLSKIENDFDSNIDELEDIYSDYEILYRQDMINNLHVPTDDLTIIENIQDLKPHLIHRFIRNPEKFRNLEIDKIKQKIIAERLDGNSSPELTEVEQIKLDKLINRVNANLDRYKVNYTTDGKGTTYTDSIGLDVYQSDTVNQISASIVNTNDLIYSSPIGIIGIGFNNETLYPEAILISSSSYKTTNKGINNLEYNEVNEFNEMSSPLHELIEDNGKSEVVIQRRGMDFDTKASYILATIDSSNVEQTKQIMNEIKQVQEKEQLKVVIYDVYKIKKSMENNMQEEMEENTKSR